MMTPPAPERHETVARRLFESGEASSSTESSTAADMEALLVVVDQRLDAVAKQVNYLHQRVRCYEKNALLLAWALVTSGFAFLTWCCFHED